MSIKPLTLLFFVLVLSTSAFAAQWVPVQLKETWDRTALGYCLQPDQCLVGNSHSETYDNQPDRYWSQTSPSEKPKCIANGQYLSDHYCDSGVWTSRTKLVALQLIALANAQSPDTYRLYCDTFNNSLGRYDYATQYGTVTSYLRKFCLQPGNKRLDVCANNICVLNYGGQTALGFASNTAITGDKSPLNALNLSENLCNQAINNNGAYNQCGTNVWYNHNTQSIIYAPGATSLPSVTSQIQDFLSTPFGKLRNYVFSVVHNPTIAQFNYSFFDHTPDYNNLYLAKDDLAFAFAFKEDQETLAQIDYAGWYFANIPLPANTCARYIKTFDPDAHCENQPTPDEFFIAADKRIPLGPFAGQRSLVNSWQEPLKIRVGP